MLGIALAYVYTCGSIVTLIKMEQAILVQRILGVRILARTKYIKVNVISVVFSIYLFDMKSQTSSYVLHMASIGYYEQYITIHYT